MKRKTAVAFVGMWLSWSGASADVSEMIFYPQSDFSEGIFHFNYLGQKNKNYAFMFEKGFDPNRIVYVRPANHYVDKTKEGMIKLSFENTDRYSYLQRAFKDDFLVSDENGIVKILLSGGDCKGSLDCITEENILTINVPKGYGVRSYHGLDQDLKPLPNPQWQRKGNTYTLTAKNVKGACIMMELERLKPGQSALSVAMADPKTVIVPKAPTPKAQIDAAVVKAESSAKVQVAAEQPKIASPIQPLLPDPLIVSKTPTPEPLKEVKTLQPPKASVPRLPSPSVAAAEKPQSVPETPAPYFRNFHIFESRVVALSDIGKERLREWARQFKAGGYTSVTIQGYTDNIPPQRLKALYATNAILSEARATMVAEYLVTAGIDPKAIRVEGMGDANPVASNDTEEGRSKNRRIEFILR